MRRLALPTALLALAAAPAAADAASVNVVRGAGFGHGIGMSQYGAYGFAQQGLGYERILKHYYRGTELGSAPTAPVRVLLQASDPFVRFSGARRLRGRRLNPRRTYIVNPASGGRLRVEGVGTFSRPIRIKGKGPMRLLGPALNGIDSGLYRDDLVLRPGALGGVTAINYIRIDPYIQGVVPGEMPSSWDYDALRAQAVAARSYALSTRKTGEVFDLYPDTRSQVYEGVSGETARTNVAVKTTKREVLEYQGDPVTTFYFSTSGGRTENVELSFLGATPQPYLKSVRDPYDDISPRHRWRFRFSDATLGARLGAPGRFRRVEVLRRGRSPRIVRARVVGSRGSRILDGPSIRARLDLYDSWAYFRRITASQAREPARRARSAFPTIGGRFTPAPRSRRVVVQRREDGRWTRVAKLRTSKRGSYRTTVSVPGLYRVRSGGLVGPRVRVR